MILQSCLSVLYCGALSVCSMAGLLLQQLIPMHYCSFVGPKLCSSQLLSALLLSPAQRTFEHLDLALYGLLTCLALTQVQVEPSALTSLLGKPVCTNSLLAGNEYYQQMR